MNPKKECQIVIETDNNSQMFDINYCSESTKFEIYTSNSKYIKIYHYYKYDSWLNPTTGGALIVNSFLVN